MGGAATNGDKFDHAMKRPYLSVRTRLLALCLTLVMALAASNSLLGYLINRDSAAQAAKEEQLRRLQIFQATNQALTLYRHKGAEVNSAILMKEKNRQAAAQQAFRQAAADLDTELNKLALFDPRTVTIIRRALSDLPHYADLVVQAVLAGRQSEAGPAAAEMQRRIDLIEDTIQAASRHEQAIADEIQLRERDRIQSAIRLANLISIAAGLVGIILTFVVVRSIIRPLYATTTAIRQVNAGNTNIDLPPVTRDEFGDVALALRQFRDQAEHLRRLAYRDPLTGLGNRAHLEEMMQQGIEDSRLSNTTIALLYINLDNFRSINDRLGHQAGDRYLCEAVARLSRFVPPDALLCRYAGDNFTVLIEGLPSDQSNEPLLREIADCALRGLSEPYPFGDYVLNMSASIGIAVFPKDGESVEQLITGADAAMYAAKKNGRNTVRFMGSRVTGIVRKQLAVAGEIRAGIDRGEFVPYYQPIVDTQRKRVVAAEALLRWHHPQRGLLLPGEFIQIAEDEGLVGKLGTHCLLSVHKESRRRSIGTSDPMRFSVNLSVRQINDRKILQTLDEMDQRDGLPKSSAPTLPQIDFEITETALLDATDQSQLILDEIRGRGYRLSLDDFGTGYSSFSYLHRLPIDKLKIDRQFISNMSTSKQAMAIISAIIALARNLELEVIAEGVETEEQMVQLRKLGCYLQQGFLFTPALPAENFERWVSDYESGADSTFIKPLSTKSI